MYLRLFPLLFLLTSTCFLFRAQEHDPITIFNTIMNANDYEEDDLDTFVTYYFIKNSAKEHINSLIGMKEHYHYSIINNSGIINSTASLKVEFAPKKKDDLEIKQYFFLFKTDDNALRLDAIQCYDAYWGENYATNFEKALKIIEKDELVNLREMEKKEIDYYLPYNIPKLYKDPTNKNDFSLLQKSNGKGYLELLLRLEDAINHNESHGLNKKQYAYTLNKTLIRKNHIHYIRQTLKNYTNTTSENINQMTNSDLQNLSKIIDQNKEKFSSYRSVYSPTMEDKKAIIELEKEIGNKLGVYYYSIDYSFTSPYISPYFQINLSFQNSCGEWYYKGFYYDIDHKKISINKNGFYFLKDLGNDWYYFERVD